VNVLVSTAKRAIAVDSSPGRTRNSCVQKEQAIFRLRQKTSTILYFLAFTALPEELFSRFTGAGPFREGVKRRVPKLFLSPNFETTNNYETETEKYLEPVFTFFSFIAKINPQPLATTKMTRRKTMSSVNQEVILLNNHSVIYLQMGNPGEAFRLLSEAFTQVNNLFECQAKRTNVVTHRPYRYKWVDFSGSMTNHVGGERKNRGNDDESIPFLFLRALQISNCDHDDFESLCCSCGDSNEHCPCGIAWVVWYNLAISCHILGCRLGEKGRHYLDRAYHLYELVRGRILAQVPSKDWSTLLMAVFNNQGCIYHQYAMYEESHACLGKLRDVMVRMQGNRDGADWQVFCLNLMLLQKPRMAGAA
jgi:hypothetical protein